MTQDKWKQLLSAVVDDGRPPRCPQDLTQWTEEKIITGSYPRYYDRFRRANPFRDSYVLYDKLQWEYGRLNARRHEIIGFGGDKLERLPMANPYTQGYIDGFEEISLEKAHMHHDLALNSGLQKYALKQAYYEAWIKDGESKRMQRFPWDRHYLIGYHLRGERIPDVKMA